MRSLADLVQATLMQRRPGAAPLLGFRRELGPRAGYGWLVTGKVVVGQDVAYFEF